MARPELLIFDFDGVLADTEDLHFAAFAAALGSEGVDLRRDTYYRRYLGLPDEASIETALVDAGRAPSPSALRHLLERKRREYARRAPQARLYPGVAELLRELRLRHLLAVASGAYREEIAVVLERAGVGELFSAVVSAEDVSRGKPAPEPFLCALEAVNRAAARSLGPARCVVIEDAPLGVQAARAAGMRCIAVTTSHDRAALAAADAVIDDVLQLATSEWLA